MIPHDDHAALTDELHSNDAVGEFETVTDGDGDPVYVAVTLDDGITDTKPLIRHRRRYGLDMGLAAIVDNGRLRVTLS